MPHPSRPAKSRHVRAIITHATIRTDASLADLARNSILLAFLLLDNENVFGLLLSGVGLHHGFDPRVSRVIFDPWPEEHGLAGNRELRIIVLVFVDYDTNITDKIDGLIKQNGYVLFRHGQRVKVHHDGFHAKNLMGCEVNVLKVLLELLSLLFGTQKPSFHVRIKVQVRSTDQMVTVFV